MTGFEIALTCLALNVFKEARGEPVVGQHAVALVTLNRVYRNGLEKDVCDVVFEPKQFSWTVTDSEGGVLHRHKRPDRNSVEWKRAYKSAKEAFYMKDFTKGATHYHEVKIRPYWTKDFTYVGQWGNHKFYRGDYGNQYQAEGAGRGARDTACLGADYSQADDRWGLPVTRQADRPAQPESERSWWQRLIEYFWPRDRSEAPRATVHQHMVEAVRDRCKG